MTKSNWKVGQLVELLLHEEVVAYGKVEGVGPKTFWIRTDGGDLKRYWVKDGKFYSKSIHNTERVQLRSEPRPSDAPIDTQPEQKFFGIRVIVMESRVKTVRAIWDFLQETKPEVRWSLSEVTRWASNLPMTLALSDDPVAAENLGSRLQAAGCKVHVVLLTHSDQAYSLVQRLMSCQVNHFDILAGEKCPLCGKVIEREVRRSTPPESTFTEFRFLAHLAELTGLYIEGAKDDDPDWLAHLGSLDKGAVDFAHFVITLDGEVREK